MIGASQYLFLTLRCDRSWYRRTLIRSRFIASWVRIPPSQQGIILEFCKYDALESKPMVTVSNYPRVAERRIYSKAINDNLLLQDVVSTSNILLSFFYAEVAQLVEQRMKHVFSTWKLTAIISLPFKPWVTGPSPVFSTYRSLVLTVAYWSPKPQVWVRILQLLLIIQMTCRWKQRKFRTQTWMWKSKYSWLLKLLPTG